MSGGDDVRHEIFREELYTYAHLPNEEFQVILEEFKKRRPELVPDTKPIYLDISGYKLRKHIKDKRGNF